ncbi:MAG: DNA-3-methyladenine glycosylase [Chthonomonas sp.]|nr:DNA-3-methyladenine glycosylase [Chthonomonas sp.]
MDLRALLESDVHEGALALLGCELSLGPLRARIVEVEAYHQSEPGCHSYRGMTPRTRVMFGDAGRAYVYFTYGHHWMLNLVAGPVGEGSAVLIRAAEPLEGIDTMRDRRPKARSDRDLLSGPGKLCAAFGITAQYNDAPMLSPDSELHIEPKERVAEVLHGVRIGLAAGKGDELPWRYVDAAAKQWISRPEVPLAPMN